MTADLRAMALEYAASLALPLEGKRAWVACHDWRAYRHAWLVVKTLDPDILPPPPDLPEVQT
jgi:hypothetical protein